MDDKYSNDADGDLYSIGFFPSNQCPTNYAPYTPLSGKFSIGIGQEKLASGERFKFGQEGETVLVHPTLFGDKRTGEHNYYALTPCIKIYDSGQEFNKYMTDLNHRAAQRFYQITDSMDATMDKIA